MANPSSWSYLVAIDLETEDGDLPSDIEVEELVYDQMSGVLDPDTNLTCTVVNLMSSADSF